MNRLNSSSPLIYQRMQAKKIVKFMRRVIARNKVWDDITPITPGTSIYTINSSTLLGNTADTVPSVYHYYMHCDGVAYFFDIRELAHQMRVGNNINPYTNKSLTRYQRYRICRHYYKIAKKPEFTELVWAEPTYQEYSLCLNNFQSITLEFGINMNIEQLPDVDLYLLVTNVVARDRLTVPISALQFLTLMNYYYLNNSSRPFRALCYLFLAHYIEKQTTSTEKETCVYKIYRYIDNQLSEIMFLDFRLISNTPPLTFTPTPTSTSTSTPIALLSQLYHGEDEDADDEIDFDEL